MKRETSKNQSLIPYFWVLPALSILALMTVAPILGTFWISLHERVPVFQINEWAGLSNYSHILQNPRFWSSLKITVYFTAASVVLEFLLGLSIALWVWGDFRGHRWVLAAILIPWVLPTAVSAKIAEWIFNPKYGVLNYLLMKFHVVQEPIVWLGTPFWALLAAVLADVWKTTPFIVLLLLAGLRSIPRSLFRAAEIDGAGPWHRFWGITLPQLKPVILVALLFRTLDAFRVFDVIFILTGGGPANTTETLSIYAYKVLFQTMQVGYGSALSFMVFLLAGLICLVYIWVIGYEK